MTSPLSTSHASHLIWPFCPTTGTPHCWTTSKTQYKEHTQAGRSTSKNSTIRPIPIGVTTQWDWSLRIQIQECHYCSWLRGEIEAEAETSSAEESPQDGPSPAEEAEGYSVDPWPEINQAIEEAFSHQHEDWVPGPPQPELCHYGMPAKVVKLIVPNVEWKSKCVNGWNLS